MTARDLKAIKVGDRIKFKAGYVNAGRTAKFLRILTPVFAAGNAQIEYEVNGQVKTLSHRAFTRVKTEIMK